MPDAGYKTEIGCPALHLKKINSTPFYIIKSPAVCHLLDLYLTLALARYIPANPVDRYTFKKWDTNDWARHNENKYFQVSQSVSSVRQILFKCKSYVYHQ